MTHVLTVQMTRERTTLEYEGETAFSFYRYTIAIDGVAMYKSSTYGKMKSALAGCGKVTMDFMQRYGASMHEQCLAAETFQRLADPAALSVLFGYRNGLIIDQRMRLARYDHHLELNGLRQLISERPLAVKEFEEV